LPEAAFVFCLFNNAYKITPAIFGVWMRLLKQLDNSVLWLPELPATARANLLKEAERRGIRGDRIVFAAHVKRQEDHLGRLQLADLFLDALIYNAHTTARDALWAGGAPL
jgi:predicted O-linked N-acetylglucosamine transferase (SPINDLY family)